MAQLAVAPRMRCVSRNNSERKNEFVKERRTSHEVCE